MNSHSIPPKSQPQGLGALLGGDSQARGAVCFPSRGEAECAATRVSAGTLRVPSSRGAAVPRGPRASLLSGLCTRLCHGPAPLVGRASVRYPTVRVMSCLGRAPVSVTVRRRSWGGSRCGTPRYPLRSGLIRFGSVRFGESPPAGSSLVFPCLVPPAGSSRTVRCVVVHRSSSSRTPVLLTPSPRHAKLRGVCPDGLLLCSVLICLSRRVAAAARRLAVRTVCCGLVSCL